MEENNLQPAPEENIPQKDQQPETQRPVTPVSQETPLTTEEKTNKLLKILIYASTVVLLLGLGALGLWFYQEKISKKTTSTTIPTSIPKPSPSPTPSHSKSNLFSLASITLMLDSPEASVGNQLGSPAELLVTDPQGRRTGVDPRTGTTYGEIPEASYAVEELTAVYSSGETAPPFKVFHSPTPLDGHYILQVIGTGSGAYTLDIRSYDKLGDRTGTTISGQIEAGSIDTYRLDYSSAPGAPVSIIKINSPPTLSP